MSIIKFPRKYRSTSVKPVHDQIADAVYKRLQNDGRVFLILGGLIAVGIFVAALVGGLRVIDDRATKNPVPTHQQQ